ncbi:MAG: glycosyltransferase [Thermodesulfobacteriota bacterium]|nr:glycosyltransferase [Thermodesulfobacteriota bacterium]
MISVIIPTFNRHRFLKDAIDSVLNQTYKDFELLVVDDGSTDGTEKIVKSFDFPIKYVYQEHKGVSAARNQGITFASGEYIAFLDSDDLWVKEKLEKQINTLKKQKKYLVCYTDEIWIYNGKRIYPKAKHKKYSGWIFEKTLPLCIISPSSVIAHKDLFSNIGGFDEGFPACEDYDMWLRISIKYPILFLEEPLIIKRGGHPDQLSRTIWGLDRFRIKALGKILINGGCDNKKEMILRYIKEKSFIMSNGAFKRKRFLKGIKYRLMPYYYSFLAEVKEKF